MGVRVESTAVDRKDRRSDSMEISETPRTLQMESALCGSHVLSGGNSSTEVVRIGDTARRRPDPWSASVDAFLPHSISVRFDGAPRAWL